MVNNRLAARPFGAAIWHWVQRLGALLTVGAIAFIGFWGGHWFLPGQEHAEPESGQATESESLSEANRVQLSPEKFAAAHLAFEQIKRSAFQPVIVMPGVIDFDPSRHVELRAASECLVQEVLVETMASVTEGQELLRLTATEVGMTRSEIRRLEASVELLSRELQWTSDTHSNIGELLTYLDQEPSPEEVRKRFSDRPLGDHRSEILAAHSEWVLAKRMVERLEALRDRGAISGREADQRASQLEIAEAKIHSIREEMAFQSRQVLSRAKAAFEAEQRKLEVAREKLVAQLGPNSIVEESSENLSEFVLCSPRAGQIVSLNASQSTRFEPSEIILAVADIGSVWAKAQISQRDWESIDVSKGQEVRVSVPTFKSRKFIATVRHVAAELDRQTLAVPLILEIDNSSRMLRPGMSIWVELPKGSVQDSISVPEGAVQRNDMKPFVFVRTGSRTFVARDVELGDLSYGRIAIQAGLEENEEVVTQNAFLLKSELLLAAEEE